MKMQIKVTICLIRRLKQWDNKFVCNEKRWRMKGKLARWYPICTAAISMWNIIIIIHFNFYFITFLEEWWCDDDDDPIIMYSTIHFVKVLWCKFIFLFIHISAVTVMCYFFMFIYICCIVSVLLCTVHEHDWLKKHYICFNNTIFIIFFGSVFCFHFISLNWWHFSIS